ncbi:MAG: RNA methyltransferase [Zoogloeaceae bacterium]|jgi:TrmH family RNA methyltransferase|nr:RNA methyltransferase [Zoogloeaceae bacterium]
MKHIISRDNPHFKAWKKLAQSGRARRQAGEVLLEGLHLVTAWQVACGLPSCILVSDKGRQNPEIADWLAGLGEHAPEPTQLSEALFAELADTETPGGLLAFAPRPAQATPPAPDQDSLLLDGVQDPGNLGAILRTAAAAGVSQALLSADCADAWSLKVLRAGQGAHFQMRIHEGVDLPDFLAAFAGESLATALKEGQSLYAAAWRHPVAWVFGSEGQGVRPPVLAAAQKRIRIPMPGKLESLNVATAAAVCLFEMVRRHGSA